MNELDEEYKLILDNIQDHNKTTFLYGGWGIGKTHFAKNVLLPHYRAKGEVAIYIDVRLFDRDVNVYDFISEIVADHFSKKEKIKELVPKLKRFGKNVIRYVANKSLDLGLEYKTEDIDFEKLLIEINNKNIVLVFDELDRVTPDTLLKALNFINGLSMIEDKKLRIIAVGNKKEMGSILSRNFGNTQMAFNLNNFIDKYFENDIDLSLIINRNYEKLLINVKWLKFRQLKFIIEMLPKAKLTKYRENDYKAVDITIRNLSAIINDIKQYDEYAQKHGVELSDGIWFFIFVGRIGLDLCYWHSTGNKFNIREELSKDPEYIYLCDETNKNLNTFQYSFKKDGIWRTAHSTIDTSHYSQKAIKDYKVEDFASKLPIWELAYDKNNSFKTWFHRQFS